LSDGIEVRRQRERGLEAKKVEQFEEQRRKEDNEMLISGLVRMTDQEFEFMCSKLPPRIRNRITQQRAAAWAVERSTPVALIEEDSATKLFVDAISTR